jgi:hypothetical protein
MEIQFPFSVLYSRRSSIMDSQIGAGIVPCSYSLFYFNGFFLLVVIQEKETVSGGPI